MVGWILMAGCDGFGYDAYVASSTVYTDYNKAYAAGVDITKKAVPDFSILEFESQAKFAKKYDATTYEGAWPYYYAVPVKININ